MGYSNNMINNYLNNRGIENNNIKLFHLQIFTMYVESANYILWLWANNPDLQECIKEFKSIGQKGKRI